ncbi:hypothetical protein GCM10022219_07720 [Microbacterium oryzae]|uniref:hypothetical protein n=1 Tax=Microbacterium oryzae TaxID=743009 RepID=UPI0012E16C9B|nr:hypothetical protein [Microbacterium oryzae]
MESDEGVDAASQLGRLASVRDDYAVGKRGEGWYHVALGVAAGVLITAQGMDQPWGILVTLAFLLSIPAFITWWRREHGWWVSGYSPRRARWVAAATGLVLVACLAWSYLAPSIWGSLWAGFVAALVVAALGFAWMAVWRREVRSEGAA